MRFGIAKSTTDSSEGDNGENDEGSYPEPLGRDSYHTIEEKLAYDFKDLGWLERAFTHRSIPSSGSKSDYERIEFLGDAVLDLAVAHLLLEAYPEAKEGELSKMRAALVNTSSLAGIAKKIELGGYIRLSRGELANGGAERPSILADVFEAVIGAIYREAGYEKAFHSVQLLFNESVSTVTPTDPKTELQEALHAAGSEAPQYLLECVEGPEHAPTFISIVQVDGQIVGRGKGATKKASQQNAAAEALERLRKNDDIDSMFLNNEPVQESAQNE